VAHALELVSDPLQRQLRGLNVALRGGSSSRAREHARNAVALINEATDLQLTPDDLLLALADGAREQRGGEEVVDRLLEIGVHRRLLERGTLVLEEGNARFTREPAELRLEVRGLLGAGGSAIDADPRWARLLADGD
jgi:hypothetical protein